MPDAGRGGSFAGIFLYLSSYRPPVPCTHTHACRQSHAHRALSCTRVQTHKLMCGNTHRHRHPDMHTHQCTHMQHACVRTDHTACVCEQLWVSLEQVGLCRHFERRSHRGKSCFSPWSRVPPAHSGPRAGVSLRAPRLPWLRAAAELPAAALRLRDPCRPAHLCCARPSHTQGCKPSSKQLQKHPWLATCPRPALCQPSMDHP